jgi:hypothetical protein
VLTLNKIAVFQSQSELDKVLPLPSGTQIGEPAQSEDGRVAICHTFTEGDLEYLVTGGAEIRETIPEDWQFPEIEEPH